MKFGTEPHKLHRADAPETSVEAAHSVDTTSLERMVYNAIQSYNEDGCISRDLLNLYPDYPYSSITARYSALQRKGLITCGPDKKDGQRVMRAVCFTS